MSLRNNKTDNRVNVSNQEVLTFFYFKRLKGVKIMYQLIKDLKSF